MASVVVVSFAVPRGERRHLLDPGGEALAQTIREQLAALPPEALCADDARAARLSACAACDHLRDGLCALCGCYVEYRAALLNRRCPDIPGRW